MGSRGVTCAAALLLGTGIATGCQVAYIPGEQRATAAGSDPAQVRSQVNALATTCDDRFAAGSATNRTTTPLRVVLRVTWTAAGGRRSTGTADVRLASTATRPWRARAPRGASAGQGCSVVVVRADRG